MIPVVLAVIPVVLAVVDVFVALDVVAAGDIGPGSGLEPPAPGMDSRRLLRPHALTQSPAKSGVQKLRSPMSTPETTTSVRRCPVILCGADRRAKRDKQSHPREQQPCQRF